MRRINSKTTTEALEYTVIHRPRVTRRLHMEIDQQGGLVVVAPGHWSKTYIRTTLNRNISRVERFLANARKKQLVPLQYKHGEQHFYLGERYPLLIQQRVSGKNHVTLHNGEICIDTTMPQPEKIQIILQNWYRRQAECVFKERLAVMAHRAPWARDRAISLKLRRMKRTWGNCSSKGAIKLNTHLVKTPLAAIDSVIAHELCHLEEMNHGKAFYRLLEVLNPNWRKDRAWLRSEGFVYLLT